MIETSPTIKSISSALLVFQGAVDGVEKNKTNPGFKSQYANLEAVRDTAVPELQRVGIVYVQSPGPIVDGSMSMTTMLIHPESGEWMKFTGDIALGKRDPQGVGSAMTYMARYSLMAALGLPPVDDDGEAAMGKGRDRATERPAQTKIDYGAHLSAIRSAKTLDELKTAFDTAKADKTIDPAAAPSLVAAKDKRKQELAKPNFDGLQP